MPILVIFLFCLSATPSLAQFGVPRPPDPGGFAGYILHKQAEFYRMLSGTIRAAKTDGSAAYTLIGISFLYGIFHAAGPGHGKAVISSYVVANDETWKRGVFLSFASAMLQAVTAIAIVGIAAALLGATARTMGDAVRVIEIVSYGLIVVIGLRLVWVKGGALMKSLRGERRDHHRHHTHHEHHHDHGHSHHADNHHHHHHEDGHAWGHAHAPEPAEVKGRDWMRRGLAAIVAVGLRPCSGAILVLVFALAQGLFWLGIVSTFAMGIGTAITVAAIAVFAVAARGAAARFAAAKPGPGMIVLRLLETGAAVLIVLFGAALLTGYLASERLLGA